MSLSRWCIETRIFFNPEKFRASPNPNSILKSVPNLIRYRLLHQCSLTLAPANNLNPNLSCNPNHYPNLKPTSNSNYNYNVNTGSNSNTNAISPAFATNGNNSADSCAYMDDSLIASFQSGEPKSFDKQTSSHIGWIS
jgi:hypothetical protein